MEVEQKIEEMQKYIPCLRLLIENLEKNPAKVEQVKKMQYLLEMLSNKDSSIKLETLVRCEGILQKIYGKEQILSSSVENESKKNGTEKQNVTQAEEPAIIQTAVKPNQSKLLNGNATETVVVVEIQTDTDVVTVSEVQKQIFVENNEDKGGGNSVGATDNVLDPSETNLEKFKGSAAREKNKDTADEDQPVANVPKTGLANYAVDDTPSDNAIHTSKDASFNSSQVKDNDINTERCNVENVTNKEEDEPAIANEPISGGDDGECDMEIDEELTNSDNFKTVKENHLSESANRMESTKDEVTTNAAVVSKEMPTKSKKPVSTSAAKSNVVDLTSDDSNDGTPTPLPVAKKMILSPPPRILNQVKTIRIPPSKSSEKPAVVYLIKGNSNNSNTKISNTVQPGNTDNAPLNTSQPCEIAQGTKEKTTNDNSQTEEQTNITTIDLLDSDSDDEGKATSERKSSDSTTNVRMPAPKVLNKPMFTIASVQSISTLQQHQERRRAIEKELYGIVKSIQYTKHHAVPQKYNTTVRSYLERFIKDLMFEKNRVNLCLQKLLKTLDTDKYKQVKKIIQTYCSEPANDPNLPEPSPFCHRIKVYPEKLQFVMRQLFFFNTGVSVIGYKVYSLVHCPQSLNGKIKHSEISGSGDRKRTLPVAPHSPQSPHKPHTTSPMSQKSQTPHKLHKPGEIKLSNHKPQMGQKWSGRTFPNLSPASSSDGDLLAPMKSEAMNPYNQSAPKVRRRKHNSDDDDDDDDENYVPQGYFSGSDEGTEPSTDTRRRTSLQRASKLRCQKYLELERTIDDETYIRATEATLAKALKGEGKPRGSTGSQPPVKKYRPASALKKKKQQQQQSEEEGDGRDSQESEMKEREQDDEDDESAPPTKRLRKSDSNIPLDRPDMEQDEAEDEDNELAPELDLTVENRAKNVTRAYHCRSSYLDRCLICHEKLNRKCYVSHYVNWHREREVYISRFPKSDILKLQSETMCFAFPSANSKSSAYVAYCIFCQQEQCLSMRNWYEHYTRHTGEYIYECSKCKARRSTRQQINRHVNIECSAKGSEVVVLKEVDPETIRIDACVCLLCNYVQLDFERLIKHLQSEHEFPGTVHELPEGTYQLMNLLRIEQNYYEGAQYDEGSIGIQNESMESVVPEDDMSFMICNMLASSSDQAVNDPLVGGDVANSFNVTEQPTCDPLVSAETESDPPGVEQALCDPLLSDQLAIEQAATDQESITEKFEMATTEVGKNVEDCVEGEDQARDERAQSPEMIIRECITTIVKTEKLDVDLSVNKEDNTNQNSSVAKLEATSNVKTNDDCSNKLIPSEEQLSTEHTNTEQEAEITNKSDFMDQEQDSQNSMEALQMDDSSELDDAEVDGANTMQRSPKPSSITKSKGVDPTRIVESGEDNSKHSVDVTNRLKSDTMGVEKDPLDTSTNAQVENKSLLFELSSIDDLTKSATESIFQRVSDSLINSIYESIEVATTVSDSTSELPDTNTISSENTMDSMSSGPQFLQSTRSPVDSAAISVHETIVPDLDEINTMEPIDIEEEDKGDEIPEISEDRAELDEQEKFEEMKDEASVAGDVKGNEANEINDPVEAEMLEDSVDPEGDELIVPESCDEVRDVVSANLDELENENVPNSTLNDELVRETQETERSEKHDEESESQATETDQLVIGKDSDERHEEQSDVQRDLGEIGESDAGLDVSASKTLGSDPTDEPRSVLEGADEEVSIPEQTIEPEPVLAETSEPNGPEKVTKDEQHSMKTSHDPLSESLSHDSAAIDVATKPTTNESVSPETVKENEESST